MKRTNQFFLLLAIALFSAAPIFSQQIVIDSPPQDSLVTYRLDDLDELLKLAGDKDPDHPYYTFLWIFGDGSFINHTQNDVMSHVYAKGQNQSYHLGDPNFAQTDVTVYAIGNYSGGTRPPRMPANTPFDFFRPPTVQEGNFKLAALGTIDDTPTPVDTSVLEGDDLLRLQFSSEGIRPQDTMAAILSFRQPFKLPEDSIRGQVFFFYNSEVRPLPPLKKPAAMGQMDNVSTNGGLPVSPHSHWKSDFTKSHIHFTSTDFAGNTDNVAGFGISKYRNAVVFNYDDLDNNGDDERHLFVELINHPDMWDLKKDGKRFGIDYMAVMTATIPIQSAPNDLPDLSLNDTTLNSLLTSSVFNDNEFFPIDPDLQAQIVGISETNTEVVSAHDPNGLTLYACECPEAGEQKVVGTIEFTNDGDVPTDLVSVTLNVPEQLNMNSLEDIELVPTPTINVVPVTDLSARTITWTWPALIEPLETTQSAGLGDPSTKGHVVFALSFKEGQSVANLDTMDACIVFGLNTPMCTAPVSSADVITTTTGEVGADVLKCKVCEEYKPEPDSPTGIDWICAMLWAVGIILLIFVVAVIRKFTN